MWILGWSREEEKIYFSPSQSFLTFFFWVFGVDSLECVYVVELMLIDEFLCLLNEFVWLESMIYAFIDENGFV
jgi:uncharacterized membrane protein